LTVYPALFKKIRSAATPIISGTTVCKIDVTVVEQLAHAASTIRLTPTIPIAPNIIDSTAKPTIELIISPA